MQTQFVTQNIQNMFRNMCILLMLLGLVFIGCGGDDDSESGSKGGESSADIIKPADSGQSKENGVRFIKEFNHIGFNSY